MTEQNLPATGGCMCGAVRYEAIGDPKFVGHCHCHSCRKHSGAPVVTWVAFNPEQVTFTNGEPKLYESSPGIKRAFCGDCGTPLTWDLLGRGGRTPRLPIPAPGGFYRNSIC